MPHRLHDWECRECGAVHEEVTFYRSGSKPPKRRLLRCEECDAETRHDRLAVQLVARYTGEVAYNPRVFGGSLDTCGSSALPKRPFDLLSKRSDGSVDTASADMTKPETRDRVLEQVNSKEWKDYKRRRAEAVKRNRAKRARESAILRGQNVNLKNKSDQLPGDPVKRLKPLAT